MTSGPGGDHGGRHAFVHEMALYGSDDELLEIAVPFLREGLAEGDTTMLVVGRRVTALVLDALGGASGLTILDNVEEYVRPTATIRSLHDTFAALVAEGASRVRVIGEVPNPGTGVPWEPWARYEAVVNWAYADLPLWTVCGYDTRTTPTQVLADVERTHPHVATRQGEHRPNRSFEAVEDFLRSRSSPTPDPIELTTPDVVLWDPTAAAARRGASLVAASAGLDRTDSDALVLATSELVTNADVHGRPPITVQMWAVPGRAVVTVNDAGMGPSDPAVGLVPVESGVDFGGGGLWIAHQLCSDVSVRVDNRGCTVRVVVESSSPPRSR